MSVIFVHRENIEGEKRVAVLPETVSRLKSKGHSVIIQEGAGLLSLISNEAYISAGATIEHSRSSGYEKADVILSISPPSFDDLNLIKKGSVIISYAPSSLDTVAESYISKMNESGLLFLAVDRVPRTTLAQMMDVLSSQASVVGYRSVLLAAEASPKLFPMLMTAAGTIHPAKVLVLGAGVAGLQAIATAKRLGAVVEAYDVRSAAKEQVESLGAKFVNLEVADGTGQGGYAKELSDDQKLKQQQALAAVIAKQDVVITTAMIPGRAAPILITSSMVEGMKEGAVVVDVAAERGGNCELTKPGERITTKGGILIIGDKNLASGIPFTASQMYSRNMEKLINHISNSSGNLDIEAKLGDEIVRSMLIK